MTKGFRRQSVTRGHGGCEFNNFVCVALNAWVSLAGRGGWKGV